MVVTAMALLDTVPPVARGSMDLPSTSSRLEGTATAKTYVANPAAKRICK